MSIQIDESTGLFLPQDMSQVGDVVLAHAKSASEIIERLRAMVRQWDRIIEDRERLKMDPHTLDQLMSIRQQLNRALKALEA